MLDAIVVVWVLFWQEPYYSKDNNLNGYFCHYVIEGEHVVKFQKDECQSVIVKEIADRDWHMDNK